MWRLHGARRALLWLGVALPWCAAAAHAEPRPGAHAEHAPDAEAAHEVTVRGQASGRALKRSAEAVAVTELAEARTRTLDLGEQLARTEGLSFRRDGGSGSHAHLALNGFSGEQVRVFLDGVPLRLTGIAADLGDLPPGWLERIEVYRGVVPLRFGADTLGGAVNLVSRAPRHSSMSVSYQTGSFGTVRLTGLATYVSPRGGWYARTRAFGDAIANRYAIDVQVPDAAGRPQPRRIRRFHDGYTAAGASVELALQRRAWARQLSVQLMASTADKELQTNPRMTVPYGEARTGERSLAFTARYEVDLPGQSELSWLLSGSHRQLRYLDVSPWVYDWLGRRIAERTQPGELDDVPHDQRQWENAALNRLLFTANLSPQQRLRAAHTASLTTRDGEERAGTQLARERHPITARRTLLTSVSALEHQLDLGRGPDGAPHDRLQNLAFAKHYALHADYRQALPNGLFLPLQRGESRFGLGDAARLRVVQGLDVKLSYEYATRQPSADEVFGNAVTVAPNLDLQSETSHNLNLGWLLEQRGRLGRITWDTNGFWRDTDRLVVQLAYRRVLLRNENVLRARTLGIESQLRWQSPGHWLELQGHTTLQDLRNASSDGAFGAYEGARIPNRPYGFGAWSVRGRWPNALLRGDELLPFYGGRYVAPFHSTWENQGLAEFKQRVPAQVLHNAGISWALPRAGLITTLEVQNLADARVYDFYGAQRPGRSVYLKTTLELR